MWNNKEVSKAFFKMTATKQDGMTQTWKCSCGCVRSRSKVGGKETRGYLFTTVGWSNLVSHVKEKHPNYREVLSAKSKGQPIGSIVQFTNASAVNIYGMGAHNTY